jgi:LexA DNA binding domain
MTAQLQPLTWAQQRLYNWIVGYVRKHGHSPTLRQMAEAMDLTSMAPIQARLCRLQNKGWLTWEPGRHRSLVLLGGAETYDAAAPRKASGIPDREIGQLWSAEAIAMADELIPLGPWGWVEREFNAWARSAGEPERTIEGMYLKFGKPLANTAGNLLSTKNFAALVDRQPRAIRYWAEKRYLEEDHIFTTGEDSSKAPWFIYRVEALLHLATHHQQLLAHLSHDQLRVAISSQRASDLAIARIEQWREQKRTTADGQPPQG